MDRRTFLLVSGGGVASSLLLGCGGGSGAVAVDVPPAPQLKAVVAWNETALEAVRVIKPGPPMAARSLAVVHTAMYDAWAAYDDAALATTQGARLRQPLEGRSAANRQKALSFAAYVALLDQFPTQKAAFDARMAALGFDASHLPADLNSAEGVGTSAARAVLQHCHADGANQLGTLTPSGVPYADYTNYEALNPPMVVSQPTPASAIPAPGNWQPLSYIDAGGTQRTPGYLAACWGEVMPFAMASADQFRPGPPAAPGTPEFLAQAQHVIDTQASLTEKQKVIAEYWADGPSSELPPGHWCLFAQFVSARDQHSDDDDIKMFFALTNALFDAGIAAWDAKRTYDSARPITAIRYLMNGKTVTGFGSGGPAAGLQAIAGEAWIPFQPTSFPTPPFPEHVSGHSTFSAAAAEVLARYTGSSAFGMRYTKPARSMLVDPALPMRDLTLEWETFADAANESGQSRIYGGIHFDNANIAGLNMGSQVGALAYAKAKKLWQGDGA
ncbi:MAG: vanadium-dependent haloperoxidase [Massilia sp.]|nr:vanadium-dependent haloperoxidase [Massilia sp.]